MLLKVKSLADSCQSTFHWPDHHGRRICGKLPWLPWTLGAGSKDRKAERTGLRDPRIASVSFFPSAGAADLGASSRTPLDRGHKAARYQLSSSPHRGGIKTFVAHSAVPALPLPDARAPSASQGVVEIADAACRELDFAVQSGALPVSAELRR